MGSLIGGADHSHLVSGQFDGYHPQDGKPGMPADATATQRPVVTAPTKQPVEESAMIESKGYGAQGDAAKRMGTDAASNMQYSKDSTIVHAPFGHLGKTSQEVFDAESHMQTVEGNKKTLSRAYDALNGGTGADTTQVK